RVQGMVKVPLGYIAAARAAGFYLKRDGYTENLYNGDHYDGRDMFALRGSLRWEPTPDTTVDVMGYWFKEDDNRMRIQKQMCQRDPTGVLGCLPGRREYGLTNTNSTFVGTLSSREFLRIQGGSALGPALSSVGLGSLYGPDANAGGLNPADPRQVYTDYAPTYKAEEIQIQAKIEHDFGPLKGKISGQFQENSVDSSQDYTLSVQNRAVFQPGINNLFGLATVLPQFSPMLAALFPNGPTGEICTSLPEETGTGSFGGHKYCSMTPQDFDRSNQYLKAWTVEGIVSSDFDGKFNFLLGAIYNRMDMKENSYYVNSFGIDYVSGILGAATALGNPALGNIYLATPFYRNNTQDLVLKSYGVFGEAYYDASDVLRFTVGLRYNNDQKSLKARSTLASFASPFTMTNAFDSPFFGSFDADPSTPGIQPWAERDVKFSEFTGRFVVDYKITDDNLLYASYSRGYKSGGINPPLQPIFAVPDTFEPEFIDAFEIGSKNRFADGTIQLNATAFYYKYKALQLSRIVARTSVNDNVDANIWGIELEGIVNPIPPLTVNLSFSYLNTEVSSDKYLADPFDPSGGRSDAVIVKDITNGANCAVVPTGAGGAALSNGYVTAVNTALGLRGPTAFPTDSGINGATGAFGICSVLAATATANGVAVLSPGVENNIKGNKLPQAPEFKVAGGVQWTQEFASGMTLVPRWDFAFTGESYGSIFNSPRTRVPSYLVMNAQVQLNAANERWFVRGFVQNITNNSAITGLYSTDQSSGNFTNIFTLEPRRYGLTAGFRF
ncbi:TonB-dependent receptor domain-containing protein, partial [Sandaracinobacter sp.]|uniref:TonB-dependent receptor domain-containing protein n=1 Tax=Sandaracinobacter sp. TaxID=2487581 RepID=UPI0035B212B6